MIQQEVLTAHPSSSKDRFNIKPSFSRDPARSRHTPLMEGASYDQVVHKSVQYRQHPGTILPRSLVLICPLPNRYILAHLKGSSIRTVSVVV
ncbi:hypothetical protein B0H65DRAFT_192839 [Neurospora tetraspora]|uniref:Uncharacterized protein n=1 Tax=Neurospora tetraspora TaxID=94610 RepID=A0AAE0JES4_9PEZI|nr:hypothetical protein B0H65DRAFT_192839 [Neurospora tetraspora]